MYVNSINQQPNFGAKVRLPRVEVFDKKGSKVADELNTVINATKAKVNKFSGKNNTEADLFLYSDKPGSVYTTKVATRLNGEERLFRVGDTDLTLEQLNARLSEENGMVDFYSAADKAKLAEKTQGLNEAAKRNVGPGNGAQW